MANTLNTPDVLTQPIATNGTKNAIPNTNDQSLGLMSQSTGFPAICSERIADGGKAPRRADFNGAFNLVSQHHFFLQNGGTETFRQSVSDAIGGYPINSRLWFTNSNGESVIVRSLIANNTYNFNNDPTYIDGIKWVVDVESGAPVGSLMPYAGTTPPDGWLICDGSEISRTTYARLFSVIGTTYGAGDGNSSFNIPNFSGARLVKGDHFDVFGYGNRILLTQEENPSVGNIDAIQLKYLNAVSPLATQHNQVWANGSFMAFPTKAQLVAAQARNLFSDISGLPTLNWAIKF